MIHKPILLDLPMPITTPRLTIRPVMPGDGLSINKALLDNFEFLKTWLDWLQKPPDIAESEDLARRFYADFILRNELHFIILVSGNLVGKCSLYDINWEIPSASIGYWGSHRGQGYITESINAVARYAFNHIGIQRLSIICDDANEPSIAVAKRLNFTLECRTKGLVSKYGCDKLRFSCCYVHFCDKKLPALEVAW